MTTNGYVYCFSNPSMPGILKIGMTERKPGARLNDANCSDTWRPPTPYVIEFAKYVKCPKDKERTLHYILEKYTERINLRREFFRISPENAKAFFDLMDGEMYNEPVIEQQQEMKVEVEEADAEESIKTEDSDVEEAKEADVVDSNKAEDAEYVYEEDTKEEEDADVDDTEDSDIEDTEDANVEDTEDADEKLKNTIVTNKIDIAPIKNGEKYHCVTCKYSTMRRYDYESHIKTKRHMRLVEKIDNRRVVLFNCLKCNFSTKKKSNYELHLLSKKHVVGKTKPNTKCLKCGKNYSSQGNLWKHNKICNPDKEIMGLVKKVTESIIMRKTDGQDNYLTELKKIGIIEKYYNAMSNNSHTN